MDNLLEQLKQLKWKTVSAEELIELFDFFTKIGDKALRASHFELAKMSGKSAQQWEEFYSKKLIEDYVENQTQLINAANARKAVLELGSAQSSVDVAKAKAMAELKRKDGLDQERPFNIYFLPSEVIAYKRAIEDVKALMRPHLADEYFEKMYEILKSVVPDKVADESR